MTINGDSPIRTRVDWLLLDCYAVVNKYLTRGFFFIIWAKIFSYTIFGDKPRYLLLMLDDNGDLIFFYQKWRQLERTKE